MSRSKQHTPIFGHTTAKSEKQDKRFWNRVYRKMSRRAIARAVDFEEVVLPASIRKETEVWKGTKEGKKWWYDVHRYSEILRMMRK